MKNVKVEAYLLSLRNKFSISLYIINKTETEVVQKADNVSLFSSWIVYLSAFCFSQVFQPVFRKKEVHTNVFISRGKVLDIKCLLQYFVHYMF